MKKHLLGRTFHIIFLTTVFLMISGASVEFYAQNFLKKSENNLIFPKNLNKPDVDFNLQSTGPKKFKIILDESISSETSVKIFDIIGNLIKEDTIKPEDGRQKTYDFSEVKSQLFVVEVGNSKYNKTKSIYATPQGTKKKQDTASVKPNAPERDNAQRK